VISIFATSQYHEDIYEEFARVASEEHTELDLRMGYGKFLAALEAGTGIMGPNMAFSERALKMAPGEWWSAFGREFGVHIFWFGRRYSEVRVTETPCETGFSTVDWQQSARQARMRAEELECRTRACENGRLKKRLDNPSTPDVFWQQNMLEYYFDEE